MNEVLTKIEGGIATLTVNRPQARNAISSEMMDAMLQFLQTVEQNDAVGVVVIDAVGDHFIAGGDVKGFAQNASKPPAERAAVFEGFVHKVNPLFLTLERMPQIVIASARGYIAGAGVSFVAGADLAIVSTTAKFMLSHIKIGAVPDAGASYYLPRQVGVKRAKEIICLGDTFSAEEALRIGLVNRVVPDDQLAAETTALAQRLASGPRVALAEAKRLVNRSLDNTMAQQLYAEAEAANRVTRTEDFVEGATAFAQKRAPVYKGR
jgi:2-(1,2-epoxy-1,2-dihydrophenyl)acetyl-CoA isomerase